MDTLKQHPVSQWSLILQEALKQHHYVTIKMGNGDVLTLQPKKGHHSLITVSGSVFPMTGVLENIIKDLLNYNDLIRLRTEIDAFVASDYNRNG